MGHLFSRHNNTSIAQLIAQRNQQAARRQPVAVPQGAQRVALGGGCAWPARTVAGGGDFNFGFASPDAAANASLLPAMGPQPDSPAVFSTPQDILRQAMVPMGFIEETAAGNATVRTEIAPEHGVMYIGGLRTLNGPLEVLLERIVAGGLDMNRLATAIDAASYASDDIIFPFDGGCVKKDQPIVVFFSAIGSPDPLPSLNINFWGTRDQSFNACYPAAALNLGLQ